VNAAQRTIGGEKRVEDGRERPPLFLLWIRLLKTHVGGGGEGTANGQGEKGNAYEWGCLMSGIYRGSPNWSGGEKGGKVRVIQ